MTAIVTVIEWLRARDKRRYGLWITHNTAKGAAADLIGTLEDEGFVLVPKSDLEGMADDGHAWAIAMLARAQP